MQTRKKNDKEIRSTAVDMLKAENLRPFLRRYFGNVVAERQEAEKRSTLAILKILELTASGQIPQRAGEDYTVTACRLVVHGLGKTKVSAETRRTLNKALAALRQSNRWTTKMVDIVEMSGWRGKRAATRALLLLALMERTIGPVDLRKWLEHPNPNLGGKAPLDLARARKWLLLADFLDDMLTGSLT